MRGNVVHRLCGIDSPGFSVERRECSVANVALDPICRLRRIESGHAGTMKEFHRCVRKDSKNN